MPVLDVQVVGDMPLAARSGLASRIADRCGEVLRSGPQQTWVRVTFLPREQYAENSSGPEEGVLPVFVSVLQFVVPDGPELREAARALTDAVADACGRPAENVHLLFQPSGKGWVAFGGTLRE